MFIHHHPYNPFVFEDTEKLVVGTIPPPRFSVNKLHDNDVDFCYGSRFGLFWPILDEIFELGLAYCNNQDSVIQRQKALRHHNIGICDIVASCERTKWDASDIGMENVQLRDLVSLLNKFPTIHTILFMGGNSKNGPEYFFRKLILNHNLKLIRNDTSIDRIHFLNLGDRTVRTVSLISPSSAANRSIGSHKLYKQNKELNPAFTTLDFRINQYKKYF